LKSLDSLDCTCLINAVTEEVDSATAARTAYNPTGRKLPKYDFGQNLSGFEPQL
jgi:hypothetical protein